MLTVLRKLRQLFPRSLLAEYMEIFGEANTLKFIDIFSGTTLEIPSRRKLEEMKRDILIYETLCVATSVAQTKELGEKLAKKFDMPLHSVQDTFYKMRSQLKENRKFKLEDTKIGKLQKSKVRIKHKAKRR